MMNKTSIRQPNIIYIHSHDTGRYVQPYGYNVPTPNIQRLADQGVLFRQAFCAAPTCSPSRAALLTGQSPHSAGMTGLVNRGFGLNDYSQHILHTLHDAGYHTVLAGLQHLHRDRDQLGFDEIVAPPTSRKVDDVAPAAVKFITTVRKSNANPFFIDIGFGETHREFPPIGPDDDPNKMRPPAPLPDTPETREDMAAYCTMARKLDEGVGMVLDALDEAGLADETLVILTTDHGVAFPGCKGNLTDHGMGVMLMMRGSSQIADGNFVGGRTINAMISHIDVFPTLCDLLSIDAPSWLQGKSFMPVMSGEVDEINDEIFGEVSYHAAYEPKRAIRTKRYKYIRRYVAEHTGHAGPVLANCDDSISKDVWLDHGWADQEIAVERLYDLVFDPNETNNLATDAGYQDILADLQARLHEWMVRTDDPILQGGVIPTPPTAVINKIDARSPKETSGRSKVTV
ncbi:MAG: sulfatase [Chloroflexota bacterium]